MMRRSRSSLRAEEAGIDVGDVVADRAVGDALLDVADGVDQPVGVLARGLQDVKREALRAFGPMPGRRCSSSIRRTRGSGRRRHRSWNLQSAHHAAHLLLNLLVGFAVRVVDGGDDQVLQHLDVVFRDHLGIDLERLHLLRAVDDDGDHAAAGVALDLSSAICFCICSCICCACFIICWIFMVIQLGPCHPVTSPRRLGSPRETRRASPARRRRPAPARRSADFLSAAAVRPAPRAPPRRTRRRPGRDDGQLAAGDLLRDRFEPRRFCSNFSRSVCWSAKRERHAVGRRRRSSAPARRPCGRTPLPVCALPRATRP